MERIVISGDGRGFAGERTGRPFIPWGFNYDHDRAGRLIEDYWEDEWGTVAADFREMRDLGANVVRVHLQAGRFLRSATEADEAALGRLGRLLKLAEEVGIYLDLTGLGCYRKADVPDWYDALGETGRWEAQALFWRSVAARCAESPAVFCYDLMNEPVVPGGKRGERDWLGPPFGGFCFVQFITLDPGERPRAGIARAWSRKLVSAIREHDRKRLVTVGLVDWSLDRPGLTSGFLPALVAPELDFLAVHVYPERGKVAEAVATVRGFAAAGKPVVIEETFPLKCGRREFEAFLEGTRGIAAGWIGFYWGQTSAELKESGRIGDAITREWLEVFRERGRTMKER
jgi:hypothetical protein